MKSMLMTWRESMARLAALRQLRQSIEALEDYPSDSRESMLASLGQVIREEEEAASGLERKLDQALLRAEGQVESSSGPSVPGRLPNP
ncbi:MULTISPECIES: hypothetical protein [Ramlibacter]|jgi:hypothetical protein|uniref:Uncharacterized protein n=1 Tax=Ramlibacter pinisoli TaxID=2682844 RepID=A0A6N8J0X6_9BURK|nr:MULTISPECIES: hypothetical protein [Ramlibacter]MBA2962530.1 hypothetical protein [Ramlibacter sp. CGMCC 1.13660]MVQ32472.1 hypothetical protein [Ramlibacter pinisoli]